MAGRVDTPPDGRGIVSHPTVRAQAARLARRSGTADNVRMDIHLNGAPREVPTDCSIARLLEDAGLAGRRVAVEVNGDIVPRGLHGAHALREGDRVEIVHALGGG